MAFRRIVYFVLIAAAIVNISCSDSPSSIGIELLSQDLVNVLQVDSSADSLFQSSSYRKKVVALSSAERILLGRKDNVEASILIKFSIFLSDSLKSQLNNNEISVVSASVKFVKNYNFGPASEVLDYSVHKINSGWSTAFTSDSLSLLNFDLSDASAGFNKFFSDSINRFFFDTQLALSWLKSTADTSLKSNNGLYLKPALSSQKIIGFQALSFEDKPIPKLELVVQKPGVYQDTLSFSPSIDLTVVNGSIADVGPENIAVQAGLNSEARLFFDLSKLPKNIVINYAQLTLFLDTAKTIVGSSYEKSLRVNYLTDSSSFAIDSTFSLFLDQEGNTFKGSVTSFIQRNVTENSNHGLLISAFDKVNGVELFAFKGSNNFSLDERPKLQIIYTTKK